MIKLNRWAEKFRIFFSGNKHTLNFDKNIQSATEPKISEHASAEHDDTQSVILRKILELYTNADNAKQESLNQITKSLANDSIVILPKSCLKEAREILKELAKDDCDKGADYERLLVLTLARSPTLRDLQRIIVGLILRHFSTGRFQAGLALFDSIPLETQIMIEVDVVTPLIKEAASRFTTNDPNVVLVESILMQRWPQINAFARLPMLCAEAPEVLPIHSDIIMLRELFRRPVIAGAMRCPIITRLYDRVTKAQLDDIELERLLLTRLKSANKLDEARILARKIAQNPAARASDINNRLDVLARLDKLSLIRRYVERLERVYASGLGDEIAIATRLWAAGFPKKALNILGPINKYDTPRRDIAMRAMSRLRRFGQMRDCMDDAQNQNLKILPTLARQADNARAYLDKRNLKPDPMEDAALTVIEDLVETVIKNRPKKFIPVPRRVLITTQSIGIGGAERQVTGLAVGLAREPDVESVKILSFKDSSITYDLPDISGKLSASWLSEFVPESDLVPQDEIDLEIVSTVFNLRSIHPFYRAIIKFRPEVVHIRSGQHIEGALAALLAGVPRVVVHFGSMTRGYQSLGNELSDQREALLEKGLGCAARCPELVLVANSHVAADDWARAMGVQRHRVGVITNCIDQEKFTRTSPTVDSSAGNSNSLVVGGVFRFAPVKDPIMWVDIAAEIAKIRPEVRFIMVGDGPMRTAVERQIDRAGLRSRFTLPGLVTTGLSSWLEKMDVFLMTSRTESLPNSVIEAQLMGLPVVAPDVGGISEVLATSRSGKVCPRNIPDLTAALLSYLDNPDLLTEIRTEAPHEILKKFSPVRQIDDTRKAYGWPA